MTLQDKMFEELSSKGIFEQAKKYAYSYSDQISEMDVFPSSENIAKLSIFDEVLPGGIGSAADILKLLNDYGGPATTAQTGGRYFGFVDGGAIPIAIACKWLTDFWDQCGGLYLTSPINSKLESICQKWLIDLFNLPSETVAGFVSGTSMANLCALSAARYRVLQNQNWDVNRKGLNGAPKIRIIAHEQVHSSVRKTLALLGLGLDTVEWIPSEENGTVSTKNIPYLDDSCIVLLQAGNVNSGAFDPFEEVCERANKAGAWVHIDGAFGLWAQACDSLKHLTRGMEKASSWAVDAHKTLNTPYDSGIVLCQDANALVSALQATADYIIMSGEREPLHYTPEMSKRSRALELWATLKYLGKDGIDEMVTGFHKRAKQLAHGLSACGLQILNDVVYNQVIVAADNDLQTEAMLERIQNSGELWCGASKWQGKDVIRVSICSWATTETDIERTINVFKKMKDGI